MADRFKYSEVRQKIIDAIRTDLIGPREKEEVLEENPRYAYLVGMLDIQSDDEDYSGAGKSLFFVVAFRTGIPQSRRNCFLAFKSLLEVFFQLFFAMFQVPHSTVLAQCLIIWSWLCLYLGLRTALLLKQLR